MWEWRVVLKRGSRWRGTSGWVGVGAGSSRVVLCLFSQCVAFRGVVDDGSPL